MFDIFSEGAFTPTTPTQREDRRTWRSPLRVSEGEQIYVIVTRHEDGTSTAVNEATGEDVTSLLPASVRGDAAND